MCRKILALLLAWACIAAAAHASAEDSEPVAPVLDPADVESWLDGVVPAALKQADIAGMSIVIVHDGAVVVEKGYGFADVAKQTPMDPRQTVVRVASVSKPFTATAVMQLVGQGKLDLNRDINDYLDFKIPAAFGKPIKLKHLLTHTAGFEETSYRRFNPPRTLREYLLAIPERIYPPGVNPAYSNYSLDLAAYIVARVSGESISAYVANHILAPLEMQHSVFETSTPQRLQPLETKYYEQASKPEPYSPDLVREIMPTESGGGGLATTAHDMIGFMLAHLQEGRYRDVQLLQPEALRLMHAPAFVPIPGAQPVALGLFRTDYKGRVVIGHSGDGEGAHAEMKLIPDQKVGFFLAMNSDGAPVGFMPGSFSLRTTLFEQFVDRYFPGTSPPQEPTTATAREHARLAAGEYAWSRRAHGDYQEALGLIVNYIGLKPFIRAHDDGTIETAPSLTIEKNGRHQRWREVAPFVWREVDGDAHLVMRVEDGEVKAVWSDQIHSFWLNLRVPFLWSSQLNVPLLLASALVLLLTVLSWPVQALIRKRRPEALHDVRSSTGKRRYRYAIVLAVVYLLGWVIAIAADANSWSGPLLALRLLQLIGLACIIGAGVAWWHAWQSWRESNSAVSKAWSTATAFALTYVVWFSFAFHLISYRID